uniref:Uncharacterized protein n=1 Tax=Romanomermis culicivorax TaxID=13658 RepID=A0A915KBY1_ROMCU
MTRIVGQKVAHCLTFFYRCAYDVSSIQWQLPEFLAKCDDGLVFDQGWRNLTKALSISCYRRHCQASDETTISGGGRHRVVFGTIKARLPRERPHWKKGSLSE